MNSSATCLCCRWEAVLDDEMYCANCLERDFGTEATLLMAMVDSGKTFARFNVPGVDGEQRCISVMEAAEVCAAKLLGSGG